MRTDTQRPENQPTPLELQMPPEQVARRRSQCRELVEKLGMQEAIAYCDKMITDATSEINEMKAYDGEKIDALEAHARFWHMNKQIILRNI